MRCRARPGARAARGASAARRAVSRGLLAADAASVLWWLSVVEIGVRLAPLPLLSRWMGAPLATSDPRPAGAGHPGVDRREAGKLRVLEVMASRWPFCDGPCLRQALVAGHILRRHRPALRIGATLAGTGVVGHAWLEVGDADVGRCDRFDALSASPGP